MVKRFLRKEYSEIYNENEKDWDETPQIVECEMCGEWYDYENIIDGVCIYCISPKEREEEQYGNQKKHGN